MDDVLKLLAKKDFPKEHYTIDDRCFDLIKAKLPSGPDTFWNKEFVGDNNIVYFNNLSTAAQFGCQWSVYGVEHWEPYLLGNLMCSILSKYEPFIEEKEMSKLFEIYPYEFCQIEFNNSD
uniref:Uncharacterized protein n=1 Tax=Marseillevirus LCMAC201 TaxID=2506605 RepID=A0A481YVP6_9VIRU|nr:MAG: hypothetical protein LCMAC201_01700 [Marseillevirus LCMAC201]